MPASLFHVSLVSRSGMDSSTHWPPKLSFEILVEAYITPLPSHMYEASQPAVVGVRPTCTVAVVFSDG